MARIKAVRSHQDYETALARIEALMDCESGSAEADELDVLVDLVEHYEDQHEPIGYPSPQAAIEFCMEQGGLGPHDLVPFIGSRAKVSEVLAGKRAITMAMARALHQHLGIPADVLLRPSVATQDEASGSLDWKRFPVKEMAKREWIPRDLDPKGRAKELVSGLIQKAGGSGAASAALFRKHDHLRANAKTDTYALTAWCWRILGRANDDLPKASYRPGTVTLSFLRQTARLSFHDDGPKRAKEFLGENGIALVAERHLPRTYLDGAAVRLGDGRPVIGLTLRYDRIDNFWFCLLHELAHVGRHMDTDGTIAFVDDQSLRSLEQRCEDPRETEADQWAEEALIPAAAWGTSGARRSPSPMAVMALANSLHVHPAIVAGRIRYEQRNYRLLSQFVGTGEVRRHFAM